ncbi:hypothetical protein [Lysobacter olei]
MKAGTVLMVAVLAAASTAGCASMKEESTYVAPPATPSLQDRDLAYIGAVEKIAQRRGIEVVWVNPPTKRPAKSGDPRQAMR